jgi:hypothetical protein
VQGRCFYISCDRGSSIHWSCMAPIADDSLAAAPPLPAKSMLVIIKLHTVMNQLSKKCNFICKNQSHHSQSEHEQNYLKADMLAVTPSASIILIATNHRLGSPSMSLVTNPVSYLVYSRVPRSTWQEADLDIVGVDDNVEGRGDGGAVDRLDSWP